MRPPSRSRRRISPTVGDGRGCSRSGGWSPSERCVKGVKTVFGLTLRRAAPPDQLAVPAKQRSRTHRQTPQGAPRQRSRERREDRPIPGPKRRSPRLPPNDRQLMPEHQDLQLLRALRSTQQHDQLKQPTERHIEERPNHARPPELAEGEAIEPPAKPTRQTANRVSEPHASRGTAPGSMGLGHPAAVTEARQ
jgi:hypothetical protein